MSNILIVENDSAVCSLASIVLQHHGHTVCVASTAEEAERTYGDSYPDILVANISLPGKSGTDFALELVRSHAHVRVLFITGSPAQRASDAEILRKMPHGSYTLLKKPFGPGVLSNTVRELLGRKITITA